MSLSVEEKDRTLALAAIVQAAMLVQQIAETGKVETEPMETLLNSILVKDAPTASSIYGTVSNLKLGIRELNIQLSKKKQQKDVQLIRYVVSLLTLERKLAKKPDMLKLISESIDDLPKHIEYFDSISSPTVVARIANIYQQTLSELKPQIQVLGNPTFLQQADNANRIRAILLAGIRAAVLWRQKGGKRWHFLFQTNKILAAAEALYASC